MLGEPGPHGVGVVEEDVDPHARVRPGDPRHVSERAACVRERLVALDPRRTGLVDDDVREHVRHVAREGDELVVGARLDRVREGAELADEAVNEGVALRARHRRGRQEPRRALEEPRRGMRRSVNLLAGDRVTADEPRRAARGGDDVRLRRAGVGDRGFLGGHGENRRHLRGERRYRRGNDCQLHVLDRLRERRGRLDGAALDRPAERIRVRVPAGDDGAGGARIQADRGADEPGADDGEPLDRQCTSSGASARRAGTRDRATGARSVVGRRASRSGRRAGPRRGRRSRRGTR